MITAGYREVWRIHGLELPDPKIHLHIANPALQGDGPTHAQIEFFRDAPNFPAGRTPRVAVVGAPATLSPGSPADVRDDSFVGWWLMVTVVGRYQLPDQIEARFSDDPAKGATEVGALVGPLIQQAGTLWCAAVVGTFAVRLEQLRFESWASYTGLLSPPGRQQWSQVFGVVVVPRVAMDTAGLQPILVLSAGALGTPDTVRDRLALALHWFLRARQEELHSVDRFLWLYLALEAAVNAATEDRPSDESAKEFAALRRLVREHDKALEPFVERIESRLRQPFISDRFRTVAAKYFGNQAEEDCRQFKHFGQLRGRSVHPAGGRVADQTAWRADTDQLETLTVRYLSAIINGVAVSG